MNVGNINIPDALIQEMQSFQTSPDEMEADLRVFDRLIGMIIKDATAGVVKDSEKTLMLLAEVQAIKETYQLLGGTER